MSRSPGRLRPSRRLLRLFAVGFLLSVVLARIGPASAQTYKIEPARSFLRAGSETPPAAQSFALATLGFQPGEGMRLERLGDFRPGSPFQDASRGMIAVFSASDALLAASELHRVRDAIDAGQDIVTSKTYHGSLETDVPEDFAVVDATVVQVPAGATHLFIAANDSLYNDNSDPDGDFAVRITHALLPATALRIWAGLSACTPEQAAGYDIVPGSPFPGVDIRDACRLVRQANGLDP